MNAAPKDITRDDLEAKFRELRGEVDTTAASAKSYAVAVGAVAVVAVIGVVYLLGRRRGKKRSTVVEVTRL
jgi:ABC-type spermidine/putrescine transport system permease subunit II